MANDAKLGLLAGVAGVLLVAVVYFPKPAPAGVPAATRAGGGGNPTAVPPAAFPGPPR